MYAKSNENADVDASTLWLSTPFRVVEPTDPSFARTVTTIEEQLSLVGGVRRYPTDVFFGSGAWPVLTASLGWHYLTIGDLEASTSLSSSGYPSDSTKRVDSANSSVANSETLRTTTSGSNVGAARART
jgi:GH15 family glucan-1,4-alpha-glucosidase